MQIRVAMLAAIAIVAALLLPVGAGATSKVYVVGNASSNVAALDIGSAGLLTPVLGSPFGAGTKAVSIAITPDGRHAYVTNASTVPASVSAYNVTATGALTPIAGVFNVGTLPLGNAVTPNGRFMYVNNRDSGDVSAFEIHGTGALTVVPGSPFPVAGSPVGITVSADGRFLYTENYEGTVSALAIGGDGALGTIPGSPFTSGGAKSWAGAVTPDGRFLYVVNNGSDDLSVFAIAADGSLALLPGYPLGTGGQEPNGIAISPDGRRLYTMNAATIAAYSISPTGTFFGGPSGGILSASAPRSGAVTPDGTRLYVATQTVGKAVLGFAIDPHGLLGPLGGSPFEAGVANPDVQALAITPNQGPAASFSLTGSGGNVTFNGSASSDPGGVVTRYDWDFGDGTGSREGGATPSHSYTASGTYRVTLTVTDNEGCSTSVIFTGQTAACNGGSAARFQADVKVEVPSVPARKPKLKLRGAKSQKLGKWIVVGAVADVDAKLVASGWLRGFKLVRRVAVAKAGKAVTLRLRVPKPARRAAAKALARNGKARAKLTVKATTAGESSQTKRTVRLRR